MPFFGGSGYISSICDMIFLERTVFRDSADRSTPLSDDYPVPIFRHPLPRYTGK